VYLASLAFLVALQHKQKQTQSAAPVFCVSLHGLPEVRGISAQQEVCFASLAFLVALQHKQKSTLRRATILCVSPHGLPEVQGI
jgi:hypothetical protein